jgi:hypothetical protein
MSDSYKAGIPPTEVFPPHFRFDCSKFLSNCDHQARQPETLSFTENDESHSINALDGNARRTQRWHIRLHLTLGGRFAADYR